MKKLLLILLLLTFNLCANINTFQKNKKACEAGDLSGCRKLGNMYYKGDTVKQDMQNAIRLYRKTCIAGHIIGCNNLGVMYLRGEGVEQDIQKAIGLYKKTCDAGEGIGCDNLAGIYKTGEWVKQDKQKAIELYSKACDMKYSKGCNNLGAMYYHEEGAKQDKQKSIKLYTKACNIGNTDACFNVAMIYYKEKGAIQNKQKAIKFFRKACDGGNAESCNIIGAIYYMGKGIKRNKQKAIKFFRKACNGKIANGCFLLGVIYDTGEGVKQDKQKAMELYDKACKEGFTEGCKKFNLLKNNNTASPELYKGWGQKLEDIQIACKQYTASSKVPNTIKKQCVKYNKKIKSTFKYGHKMDKVANSDNLDLDMAEKYNQMLHTIEEMKDYILQKIEQEIQKARINNDINYYTFLIETSDQIKLYYKDYEFINKHSSYLKKNPRYMQYKSDLKKRELEKKKQKEMIQKGEQLFKQARVLSEDASSNDKVEKLDKQACELNHAEACYRYGFEYTNNYLVPDNPYFLKACHLKHAEACSTIAMTYFDQNKRENLKYTKLACEYGEAISCMSLSRTYFFTDLHKLFANAIDYSENEAKRYEEKGESLLLDECHNGNYHKCNILAAPFVPQKNVQQIHSIDINFAMDLYKLGCNNGNKESCRRLIELYDNKFITINPAYLLKLYEKSCDFQDPVGGALCEKVGKMYYSQKNYSKAMYYLSKTCKGINLLKLDSCYLTGKMYQNAEGIERNLNEAKQYFEMSCEYGKGLQEIISEDILYGCRAYHKLEK